MGEGSTAGSIKKRIGICWLFYSILQAYLIMINHNDNLKYLVESMRKRQDIHLEMFATESDRAAAVLGGALIDDMLGDLLKSRLLDDENTRRLFKYPNILGSFGARLELARAMGIIGPTYHSDIKIVNDIRNFFAHVTLVMDSKHSLSSISFKSQKPNDLCKNFSLYKTLLPMRKGIPVPPRLCFEREVGSIAAAIAAAIYMPKERVGKQIKT